MENGRFEGVGHQVKGVLKQKIGLAIGDAKLAADGTTERAAGDRQVAANTAAEYQMFGIDSGRVMGIVNQLKGAVMQSVGTLVGNPKLHADGVAQQRAGKAQNAAGGHRDEAREAPESRAETTDGDRKSELFEDGPKS